MPADCGVCPRLTAGSCPDRAVVAPRTRAQDRGFGNADRFSAGNQGDDRHDQAGRQDTFKHRFPVTVHVIEGAFTLEMQGRTAVTVKSGESLVEPPNVKMTGYNRGSETLELVIFYVSEPDTPFLEPVR